ncbi:MAG: serine/threonine-protein kinase [bacterium]
MIAKYGKFEYALAEHYRFEDELGRGAMGAVYRATDVRLGRPVAIKLLHAALTNELGAARFQSEIRIAAGLHHPNIIGVHDCGEADGRLYYVMDYLGGETLRDRLNRERQLPIEDALHIVEQVADGLQYAHDHDVVHRDIKPENIVLAEGRACLVDFGLARALGDVDATRLTASGVSVGTPHYLSPEQAAGEKEVGPRADQYGLACVLYEMIAGESPFTGPTAQSIAMRHISERPRSLRTRRHATPKSLDDAVLRALEKVPADRFATVKQFACALRTVSIRGPAVRPWLRPALAAALLVTVAVGAAIAYSRSRSTSRVVIGGVQLETPAAAERQRRIAVLYFDDNSDQHRLRYLADGLTESVITQLSAVQGLSVVSRNGVRQFRDSIVSFDAMVRTLNVGSVVEGSLRSSGESVYVAVRLVDAESQTAISSTTIVRPANNIVSLDDEVGSQVSNFLRRRLGEQVRLRGVQAGTRNAKALDLVFRAERLQKDATALSREAGSISTQSAVTQLLVRADRLLASAELEDTVWSQPSIGRGWVALKRASVEDADDTRRALLETAHRHAQRAMARDSLNPVVLELLGTVEWNLATIGYTAKLDERLAGAAREHLLAAVNRDTSLASAWATLSILVGFSGRAEEASEADLYAKRALESDAYLENAGGILNGLFRSSLHLGDYAAARSWCNRGKRTAPGDWRFVECDLSLMVYENAKAQPAGAWSIVEKLAEIDPPEKARAAGLPYNPIHRRVLAAVVSARAGDHIRARTELTRARSEVAKAKGLRTDLLLDEAVLLHALGERDSAAACLQNYIAVRGYQDYLAADPLFSPIRPSTPRP